MSGMNKLLLKIMEIQKNSPIKENDLILKEKFQKAFPELSTEVITWFKKNKNLL